MTRFQLIQIWSTITPMDISMPISPNHRTFRCFRVGGPARPVSLNLSAGPARQSQRLLFFLLTKLPPLHSRLRPYAAPPPPLLRCPSAAAHALLLLATPSCCRCQFPAPPARRIRATPTPLLHHPRATAIHVRRHRSPALPPTCPLESRASSPSCSTPSPSREHFEPCFEFSPPLIQVHTRCSRNCLLGFFFDFFPDLQGYGLYTLFGM